MKTAPAMRMAMALLLNLGLAFANSCLEGGKPQLPAVIGEAGSGLFNAYYIDCDTAYVPVGDTTVVHSSTRLIFNAKVPQQARTIVVEGTLIIRGTDNRENFVAASLVESEFGMVPSQEKWNGFRVGPKGSLLLNQVNISNADTVIRSASNKILLDNVRFFNCKRIEVASRTQDLDYKYTRVVLQDFAPVPLNPDLNPLAPVAAQPKRPEKKPVSQSGSTAAYWWVGSAAGLATAAGLVWYLQDADASPTAEVTLAPPDLPSEGKR
jgi:hypothetical protein